MTKHDLDSWARELDCNRDDLLLPQFEIRADEQGSSQNRVEYNVTQLTWKGILLARLSWLPTPDSLNANRKGNLGYWTGAMEDMWCRRVDEIEKTYRPLNAGAYAKWSFGKLGKEILRISKEAASEVLQRYGQSTCL